jgi:hypothetical protein
MKEQFLDFHHEPQNAARSFLPEKDREENELKSSVFHYRINDGGIHMMDIHISVESLDISILTSLK